MKPNIVLITSDQHRGDCFGFDKRHVKTPHIDSMAERGTRFSACTTPNPVCMPAGASAVIAANTVTIASSRTVNCAVRAGRITAVSVSPASRASVSCTARAAIGFC